MLPWWSWVNSNNINFRPFFTIRKPESSRETRINFPYEIKIIIKTCLGCLSTFDQWTLNCLSYPHGAGVLQRGHFGGSFGVTWPPDHGSPRRALSAEESASHHVLMKQSNTCWKHCAPAQRNCCWDDILECGEVMSRPNYMIFQKSPDDILFPLEIF